MKLRRITIFILCLAMVSLFAVGCQNNQRDEPIDTISSSEEQAVTTSSSEGKETTKVDSTVEPGQSDEPIMIACLGPMTGRNEHHGQAYQVMVQYAIDQYNEEGGYQGRPVQVDFFDTKSDPTEGVNAANLIISKDYVACIGAYGSTVSLAIAPIFESVGMPLFTPSSTHVDFTEKYSNTIRLHPTTQILQSARADMMYNDLGFRKAAFVYFADDSGVSANELFTNAFTELGGEVLVSEGIAGDTADFSSIVTKIRGNDIDNMHLNINGISDAATLIRQTKEMDLDPFITVGTSNMDQEFIDLLGDDAEGVLVLVPFDPSFPSENIQNLVNKYSELTGGGVLPTHGFLAYETTNVILKSMDTVGLDSEALIEHMRNGTFEGSSGTFEIIDGNAYLPLFRISVQNGEFKTYED